MQEIVFSLDLIFLLFLVLAVIPIYFLLVKKQIYSWFDPMLVFVITNSISVGLVTYLYLSGEIKQWYFISFCSCVLAFIFGFRYGGKEGLPKWFLDFKSGEVAIHNHYRFSKIINLFLIISLIIVIGANLALFLVKGTLPILSDNPSRAKVILYTGGWGIVRRINFTILNFIFCISFFKLFHPFNKLKKIKKKIYLIIVFIAVLLKISMGSKGGLLVLLAVIFPVFLINKVYNESFKENVFSINHLKIIKKSSKYFFITAFLFVFIVISLTGYETSRMDALITRVVSYGDAFYFFYKYDILSDFRETSLSYIPHFLNPLTSMLRLTEYEHSIGALIIHYSIGMPLDKSATFGPNAQPALEGLIYFGKFGAPFYTFLVGLMISKVRVGLLNNLGSVPDNIKLFRYVFLSSIITTAAVDVPSFMLKVYDSLFFGIVILLVIITMFLISKLMQR